MNSCAHAKEGLVGHIRASKRARRREGGGLASDGIETREHMETIEENNRVTESKERESDGQRLSRNIPWECSSNSKLARCVRPLPGHCLSNDVVAHAPPLAAWPSNPCAQANQSQPSAHSRLFPPRPRHCSIRACETTREEMRAEGIEKECLDYQVATHRSKQTMCTLHEAK